MMIGQNIFDGKSYKLFLNGTALTIKYPGKADRTFDTESDLIAPERLGCSGREYLLSELARIKALPLGANKDLEVEGVVAGRMFGVGGD